MLTLPRGSAHEIILFVKQMHENRGRVPRFSCFLKLCVRNLSHMPQIDDQQRSAGEHPLGNENAHQHLERGHETETVAIQMRRKTTVPSTVKMAGSSDLPMPRSAALSTS